MGYNAAQLWGSVGASMTKCWPFLPSSVYCVGPLSLESLKRLALSAPYLTIKVSASLIGHSWVLLHRVGCRR
jgi:hypothetical protein